MGTRIKVYTAVSDLYEEDGYDQIPPNILGAVLEKRSISKAVLYAVNRHVSSQLRRFYAYASLPYASGGYYYGLPTGDTLTFASTWQSSLALLAKNYTESLDYDQVVISNIHATIHHANYEDWGTVEPAIRKKFILAQLHSQYFIDESQGYYIDVYAYEYDSAGNVIAPTQPKLFLVGLEFLQVITTVDITNPSNPYDTYDLLITSVPNLYLPVNVNRLSNSYMFVTYTAQYVDAGVTKSKTMTIVKFNPTPLVYPGILTNSVPPPYSYYPMIPQAVNRDWIRDSFDTAQVESVETALRKLSLRSAEIKESVLGQDATLDDDIRDIGVFIGCKPRSTKQHELGLVYETLLDYHNYKSAPGHFFGGATNFSADLGVSEYDLQNPDYSLRDISYKPSTIVGGMTLDIKLIGDSIVVAEPPFHITYTKDRSLLFTTLYTGSTTTYTVTEDLYNNVSGSLNGGITGAINTVYTIQFDDAVNGVTRKLVFYNLLQTSLVHVTEGIQDYLYHKSIVATYSTGEGSSSFTLPVLRSSIVNADNGTQRELRANVCIKMLVNLANIQHLSAWEEFLASSFFSFILEIVQIASIILTIISFGSLSFSQIILQMVKQYAIRLIVTWAIKELGDFGLVLAVVALYYGNKIGIDIDAGSLHFDLPSISFADLNLDTVKAIVTVSNAKTAIGIDQLNEDIAEFKEYKENVEKSIKEVQELLGDKTPLDQLYSDILIKSDYTKHVLNHNYAEVYEDFYRRTLNTEAGEVGINVPEFLVDSMLTLPQIP